MALRETVRSILEYLKIVSPRIDWNYLPQRFSNPEWTERHELAGRDIPSSKFIFVHGIDQRSGTVFLGELIRLHPDVKAYPHNLWEIPYLDNLHHLVHFDDDFLNLYRQNEDILKNSFFLNLITKSFLEFLLIDTKDNHKILLKQPSVKNLSYFPSVFPRQSLVVIVRDGRDVVSSKIKTWPHIDFETACHSWNTAAREIIACEEHFKKEEFYTRIRFESLLNNRESILRALLHKISLPLDNYPFEALEKLPIRGSSETANKGDPHWKPVPASSRFNPVGRWSNWSDKMKRTFGKIAGESMNLLGYEF